MADKTYNIKLNKPGYGEDADVGVFNTNMDIIDEKVGPAVKFIPELLGSRDQILRNNGDGTTRWEYAATPEEVASAAYEWMDEHISQGETLAIDDSLYAQGFAADAKAAGDRIRALEDNMITVSITDDNSGNVTINTNAGVTDDGNDNVTITFYS